MEYYANLHSQQYQLQDQAVARTTLPTLHTTVLLSTGNKFWNSTNFILNDTTDSDVYNHHHHQLTDQAIPNPRVCSHHEDFWHHYELPLSNNIKEKTSADSFSKLSTQERIDDINNSPLDPNKLLSTNFNHSCEVVYSGTSTFGGFSNIRYDHFSDAFPESSTNYKTASDSVLCSSSSLGLNLHGLDLLSTNQTSNQSSSHVNLGLYNKHSTSLGHDQDVQESRVSPSSNCSNTTTGFINEVSRTKRPNSGVSEPKVKVSQASAKKSRPTLRSSNPPLKIRKEKLGDRIAALHRLVAPFGKTDTASVLTEAIGYIQFLHDQVQTMSVPYMMKSLNNKPSRKMQQGLSREEEKETKLDLRSRGLCLVPKSCVSYFSGYD